MTTPTFRLRDEDTIEVHAPDCTVYTDLSQQKHLFLDKDQRVMLSWVDTTEAPDVYLLDAGNAEIALSLHEASYYEFDSGIVVLPEITYEASLEDTAENILAELTARVTEALTWAEQGYPLPSDYVEIPNSPGTIITEAVTLDGRNRDVTAALGDDYDWYGRWVDEDSVSTEQLASFVHDGRRYVRDPDHHSPRFSSKPA